MRKNSLVWWHLSDLHWEVQSSTDRRAFLTFLHESLKSRLDEFGPPDFVVFTGDVTFSGDAAQFDAAEQHFFAQLRGLLGGSVPPFFFVPGNHDLRRTAANAVNPQLIQSLTSNRSLNEFLDEEEYVAMVRRPFAAFDTFMSRLSPNVTPTVLGWHTRLAVGDTSILLLGVNSAWASSFHKNSDSKVDDERHLLIGQRQLLELVESRSKGELVIVMMHHPLTWLNGFSDTQTRQLLQSYADFVLFGHTHALHDLSQTISAAGAAVFLPAPAIYDRAPTDTVEYARGYNVVRFDTEARRGAAHYYLYSDRYRIKFRPAADLFPGVDQSHFPIDLSRSRQQAAPESKPRYQSLADALASYPAVAAISQFLETALNAASLERHTVEYFETIVVSLARESDVVDQDLAACFWEAVVLSRALIYCDLVQLGSLGQKPYLCRHSVDHLCSKLDEFKKVEQAGLQLTVDEYRHLFSLSFDSCSFNSAALSAISEPYRRLFALPWAMSRLLLYLDYPELIPFALRTEGRVAALYVGVKPERLSILSHDFEVKRSLLTISLRIQDKNAFFAVTLLKHYFDIVIRLVADLWRQSQRVLPPLTLLLDFPRWRNKVIDAYELTVETTPIVRLLMGRAMYRDARHVWFRELLQNALDANSARRSLDETGYDSRLNIELHGSGACIIRDNGIGMSRQHILLYLTRLGRSIWNSEELTDGKGISRENALRAIGKFGIGFAAVFQDAERVLVRTKFFREIGEAGWLVDFTSVEKPFLLEEAADVPIGTEVEIQLKTDKDRALSPTTFAQIVREFFVYIDDNVFITPDVGVARNLAQVELVDTGLRGRLLFRDCTSNEQIGPYRFRLRCMFGFDLRQKEKSERPPASYLLVANAGVRVFQQGSLLLKPGKQYILVEESNQGTKYEDQREHGIKHFWVIIDFEKGASPILPSRSEIDIDKALATQVLDLVQKSFCDALQSVAQEIAGRPLEPAQRRKLLLSVLRYSTENYHSYSRRRARFDLFCNVAMIENAAVEIYTQYGNVRVQSADDAEHYITIEELRKQPAGVFVAEAVGKSPLFRVYAKAMNLHEWVIVDEDREYALFSKAIGSVEWKGFALEKDIYAERLQVFDEIVDSPLTVLVRGDYAVIANHIFGDEAFIVLPTNIPGSWKRGEAAAHVRKDVMKTCPARVLINPRHTVYECLSGFAAKAHSAGAIGSLRELKLLLDNLCDGVIESERVTVARERWRAIQRDLRALLGGKLPETSYSELVVRRQ
jgi:predicted MPP superfamily phosphohydrolase